MFYALEKIGKRVKGWLPFSGRVYFFWAVWLFVIAANAQNRRAGAGLGTVASSTGRAASATLIATPGQASVDGDCLCPALRMSTTRIKLALACTIIAFQPGSRPHPDFLKQTHEFCAFTGPQYGHGFLHVNRVLLESSRD